jgi:hypothetical protein
MASNYQEEDKRVPFMLQQGPFSQLVALSYPTLADANASILFKTTGMEVYIISEDAFYYWNGSAWIKEIFGGGGGGGGTDVNVKIDINDTTTDFLAAKLSIDSNGALTIVNPGGNERLAISIKATTALWNANKIQDIIVDPLAIAANKVLQYDGFALIYAFLPAAQITNVPFGSITATDVQTAINQLSTQAANETRAGFVLPGSFAGNPQSYLVIFSSPMTDLNYAIDIVGEDVRSWSYNNKTINGFTIISNSAAALTGEVSWIALHNI